MQQDKPKFGLNLPARDKGFLLNLFNLAVRDGETEPNQIIYNVGRRVKRYLDDPQLSLERAAALDDFRKLLNTMEAFEYAHYVLGYEYKPYEQKQAIKIERAEQVKQKTFGQQPATDKQIRYLRVLGYQGKVETKQQASDLIGELLKKTA